MKPRISHKLGICSFAYCLIYYLKHVSFDCQSTNTYSFLSAQIFYPLETFSEFLSLLFLLYLYCTLNFSYYNTYYWKLELFLRLPFLYLELPTFENQGLIIFCLCQCLIWQAIWVCWINLELAYRLLLSINPRWQKFILDIRCTPKKKKKKESVYFQMYQNTFRVTFSNKRREIVHMSMGLFSILKRTNSRICTYFDISEKGKGVRF